MIAVGVLVVALSVREIRTNPPAIDWLVLIALTLLAGSYTLKLPSVPANLSVSETFIFTAVLLFGPAAGTLTVLVDALVVAFWTKSTRRTVGRFLFNVAAPSISIRVGADFFFFASGTTIGSVGAAQLSHIVGPLIGLGVLYFLVNAALIAGAVWSSGGEFPLAQWRRNLHDMFPAERNLAQYNEQAQHRAANVQEHLHDIRPDNRCHSAFERVDQGQRNDQQDRSGLTGP